MMFSTKAEYGVRVMVELARRAGEFADASGEAGTTGTGAAGAGTTGAGTQGAGSVVPLAEIAEHDGMPLAYLEHLVARLRKAGLIDSRRGSRGGYMLARPAEQITAAEIVEALEGAIAPIECISQGPDGAIVCSRESDPGHVCPTKLLWMKVRFSIVKALEDTTLADLLVPSPAALAAATAAPALPA